MKSIWTLGEALCEIMRDGYDKGLASADCFRGPYPSGAPAIFIDTVAKLGWKGGLIGAVGDDAFGRCICKKLEQDGADMSCMSVDKELSTAVAFVAYKSSGERTFIYHIGNAAAGHMVYPQVMPEDVGIFHVMGCAMMPSVEMAQKVKRAVLHYYDQGAMITFDPNIRIESLRDQNLSALIAPIMERCSIFMPGLDELLFVTGADSVDSAAERLFENPVLKMIVIKNGGHGTRVITRDEDFTLPVCKTEILDSTGAGDSFDAGFLVGYMQGKTPMECARMASAAGALNCAAFGPMEGKITPEAIEATIRANYR